VLTKRRKRVLKLAKGLEDLDPEARHKVRIEIKKLRYGAEFFGDLFMGRKAKDRRKGALKAMAELQEALGELNDIAVGGHLLAPADPDPAAQPDHERRVEELLREAAGLRRSLAGTKPFWK
jgi:CHAD domain-containing protein